MENKHGDERSRRIETRADEGPECFTRDGQPLGRALASSVTESVVEKWCSGCSKWIEVRGVVGALAFLCEHDEHGRPAK